MTEMTIRAAALQALTEAGDDGLTLDAIMRRVIELRGDPNVKRQAIHNAVHEARSNGGRLARVKMVGEVRIYTLARDHDAPVLPAEHRLFSGAPLLPPPASLTAELCGDPRPGRSALDQRRAAHA